MPSRPAFTQHPSRIRIAVHARGESGPVGRSQEADMNYQDPLTRRSAVKALGALGAAALAPACSTMAAQMEPPDITDADIFNFALNLETLETEYYTRGTAGHGMDDADAGPNPATVTGG